MTTHPCHVCGSPAAHLAYGGKTRASDGEWVIKRVWLCGVHEVEDRDERERRARG